MSIGKEIRRRRGALKMTQEDLALAAGTDSGNISRIERDLQGVSQGLLERIASTLNCEIADLYQTGEALSTVHNLMPRNPVPVVGSVQGGDNGYLVSLDYPAGHGDGYLRHASKDSEAYAVKVRGDSMAPRIRSGEFIVVEPNTEVTPGDDVVAIFSNGKRMVKTLLYRRDGEICLGSINENHAKITALEEEIESLHYVAAIMPRGAFISHPLGLNGK